MVYDSGRFIRRSSTSLPCGKRGLVAGGLVAGRLIAGRLIAGKMRMGARRQAGQMFGYIIHLKEVEMHEGHKGRKRTGARHWLDRLNSAFWCCGICATSNFTFDCFPTRYNVNLTESFHLATDPRSLEFEYFVNVIQYDFTARTSVECPLPTYHVYLNTVSLSQNRLS